MSIFISDSRLAKLRVTQWRAIYYVYFYCAYCTTKKG